MSSKEYNEKIDKLLNQFCSLIGFIPEGEHEWIYCDIDEPDNEEFDPMCHLEVVCNRVKSNRANDIGLLMQKFFNDNGVRFLSVCTDSLSLGWSDFVAVVERHTK